MDKEDKLLLFSILNAIASELYSLELMLADAYNGKINLRYSNEILARDAELSEKIADAVQIYADGVVDEKGE